MRQQESTMFSTTQISYLYLCLNDVDNESGNKINHVLFKAALTLNDLYDSTCMIRLVWLWNMANSYKLDIKIIVWNNFWGMGWVLFLPTCMKEINQSHFKFNNAELFCKVIFWKVKKIREVIRKNGKDERPKRSKCWTVHSWVGRIILITITLV